MTVCVFLGKSKRKRIMWKYDAVSVDFTTHISTIFVKRLLKDNTILFIWVCYFDYILIMFFLDFKWRFTLFFRIRPFRGTIILSRIYIAMEVKKLLSFETISEFGMERIIGSIWFVDWICWTEINSFTPGKIYVSTMQQLALSIYENKTTSGC